MVPGGGDLLRLLIAEARVLRVDVSVGAGGRLKGHGADRTLVENLAVRGLDVGLNGIHPSKHHSTTGAPGSKNTR